MAAKPNVLATNLLGLLREAREQGGDDYPPRLSRLAMQAEADLELFAKAVKNKAFAGESILAQKKNPDSLVALKEDAERMAGDDRLLLGLLERSCTPESPTIAADKMVKLVEKPLREPLMKRLQEQPLPDSVGSTTVRNKLSLYLKRMPPPRPPGVELAEKVLQALEKAHADLEFAPWSLARLKAELGADDAAFKKALGLAILKPRLLSVAKEADAPMGLKEDEARLLQSDALVEWALRAARKDDHQAVALADMRKKVGKVWQTGFGESLEQRVANRQLPQGVGLLRVKKQPCFFLWSDAGVVSAPAPSAPPSSDFASAFAEAFERLDRQRGGHNLVSLEELRRAVPADRATFDRELQALRRAGRWSLSGAEGRHGLTPEEQAAGIAEAGSLLLYVAARGAGRS